MKPTVAATTDGATLILPAFWVDEKRFPTEVPVETSLGQVFMEGYDGPANHFGWMDLVQLKDIIKKCNISRLILQDIDTLGRAGFMNGTIVACLAYKYKNTVINYVPENDLSSCTPLYTTISYGGWECDANDAKDEIPIHAKNYLRFILVHTKVKEVCTIGEHSSVTAFWNEHGLPRFKEKHFE